MNKSILVATVLLGLAGSTRAANLILNGSFENPVLADSTIYWGPVSGWTTTTSSVEVQRGVAGAAYDGAQLLELDGPSNSDLYQDVPTTPGAIYSLSLWYSPRPDAPASTNGVEVWFGGVKLAELTGEVQSETVWSYYNYEVVGEAGASSRVEFRASGDSDGLGGYIDDVQLEPRKPEGVPDGGSLTLLLAASVLGLEGVRRRMKA